MWDYNANVASMKSPVCFFQPRSKAPLPFFRGTKEEREREPRNELVFSINRATENVARHVSSIV